MRRYLQILPCVFGNFKRKVIETNKHKFIVKKNFFTFIRFYVKLGRKTYVTPTSYLQLISGFKNLISNKQNEIMSAKRRYVNGLEKLAFAESQVSIMQHDLEQLQPQLKQAAEETQAMMKTIETESKQAEEQRTIVSSEEAIANEKASQAQALKVIIYFQSKLLNKY